MGGFLGGGSKVGEDGIPRRSGVGGVVNGLLETLGDIALVQSGLKPVFGPQHQLNRINTVMQGYEDDPSGTIQRVQKISPDYAEDLRKSRRDDAAAGDTRDLRAAQIAAEQDKGYGILGSMAGTLSQENWPQMSGLIRNFAAKRGLDIPDLPDAYDENTVRTLRNLGVTSYQQQRLEDYDIGEENDQNYRTRRLEQMDEAEEGRATRFREGQDRQDARTDRTIAAGDRRAAKPKTYKPSEAEVVQNLLDKDGPLTPGEKARVDKFTKSSRTGSGRTPKLSGTSTGPASGKYVIRNGRLVKQ